MAWYPRVHGMFASNKSIMSTGDGIDIGFNSTVNSISIDDTNDAVYVGGAFTKYGPDVHRRIVKLLPNGTWDTTFYPSGLDSGNRGFNGTSNSNVHGILLVPEYVSTGTAYIVICVGLFDKFNNNPVQNIVGISAADGIRDYTFACYWSSYGLSSYGLSVIQKDFVSWDDNRIVVAGPFLKYLNRTYHGTIAIEFDGSINTTYSKNGWGFEGYSSNENIRVKRYDHGSGDVRYYHVGSFTDYWSDAYDHSTADGIVALNENGLVITSFNCGVGFVGTPYDVDIDSDENIYVVGSITSYKGTTLIGNGGDGIVKLDKTGTKLTFNSGNLGFDITPLVVRVDYQNRIMVGGSFTEYRGTPIGRIIRLNSNGTIDNTFKYYTNFDNAFNGWVKTIEFDKYHNIYIGGDFTTWKGTTYNRFVKLDYYGNALTENGVTIYYNNALFYNWYAVDNANNLAPTGWHIPTHTEWSTLSTYIGSESITGGVLRTNGFNALELGERSAAGVYENRNRGTWWSSTEAGATNAYLRHIQVGSNNLFNTNYDKNMGFSIRCIKDSGTWSEGLTMTDIDGNVYSTVLIGTQIWTVQNLKTSKYRNGTQINYYTVVESAGWSSDTTGGCCFYNNDPRNL